MDWRCFRVVVVDGKRFAVRVAVVEEGFFNIFDAFFVHLVAFNIYDIDRDGYISNGELFLALKIMSGDHLEDVQLQVRTDVEMIRFFTQFLASR